MSPPRLPIDDILPQLVDAVRQRGAAVLRAQTGAGKTTRVPPALLDAGLAEQGSVLVVQPRRVAARMAARRMAVERGARLGGEVGYAVRFDSRCSDATRVIVLTEGVLLRMLQDDPLLERAAAVVFDEFHERHLLSDVALAMVRRIRETVRPELGVVVMSATLEPAPVTDYLGGCPAVQSEGRQFPVELDYQAPPRREPIHETAATGVRRVARRIAGDLLVFLPGVGEIRQTERALEGWARASDTDVCGLYGDLPPQQQDAVLLPGPRRKVVLATNVAETSLTIEGITAVVDTGLARSLRFDPATGLDRLELGPISQAAADQRAGRAGRLQPGYCLRLWERAADRSRPPHELPEVQRVDLAGVVLQLRDWGERDLATFPWYQAPDGDTLAQADALLERLGAIDGVGGVTALGRAMARLPLAPRLARLLIEGQRWGVERPAALAAALLSERDPFRRGSSANSAHGRGSPPTVEARTDSDLGDRVSALQVFARTGERQFPCGELQSTAARQVLRTADQLGSLLAASSTDGAAAHGLQSTDARHSSGEDEPLLRAVLAAFPDRLARRRGPRDRRGVLASGRGVRLAPYCRVQEAELFVCVDVDNAGPEAVVRQASAVRREWLPAAGLRIADELFFHPTQRRVVARRRTYWDQLLLEETGGAVRPGPETAAVLSAAARQQWERAFPEDDSRLQAWLLRLACLRGWMPELALPQIDRAALVELLDRFCQTSLSLDELRRAPWWEAVREQLSYQQQQQIDREAPQQLAVPSGRRIPLQYAEGRPPVLAVRIQELFGLRATPRVAGGRVAVLLHLLAPNHRPQQVTDDLESFWQHTYPLVRKELRARYPKHAWPEDPLSAPPAARPQKRQGR